MARKPSTKRRFAGSRFPKTGRTVFKKQMAPARTGGFFGVGHRRSREEKKFVDQGVTLTAANTTGSTTAINLIATGTDYNNRIGRKVILKSVMVRALVSPDIASNTTDDQAIRCMLVYDAQTNSTLAGVNDILEAGTTNNAYAFQNLNNRDRFKVLMDKTFATGKQVAASGLAGSNTVHFIKKFKRLNHEVIFSGTTAAIGSIQTGSLLWLVIGSSGAGLTDGSVSWNSRIRFVDA